MTTEAPQQSLHHYLLSLSISLFLLPPLCLPPPLSCRPHRGFRQAGMLASLHGKMRRRWIDHVAEGLHAEALAYSSAFQKTMGSTAQEGVGGVGVVGAGIGGAPTSRV